MRPQSGTNHSAPSVVSTTESVDNFFMRFRREDFFALPLSVPRRSLLVLFSPPYDWFLEMGQIFMTSRR